jgi:hypothetical protein
VSAGVAAPEITRLLQAAADGEPAAMGQVVHDLYQALHQLAAAQLGRERIRVIK